MLLSPPECILIALEHILIALEHINMNLQLKKTITKQTLKDHIFSREVTQKHKKGKLNVNHFIRISHGRLAQTCDPFSRCLRQRLDLISTSAGAKDIDRLLKVHSSSTFSAYVCA